MSPEPYLDDGDFVLYVGDVRDVLAELPDESVDCVVTSPPYWGLRDYGTGEWEGGDVECDHKQRANHGHAGDVGERNAEGNAFRNSSRYVEQGETAKTVCKCGATRVDRQLGLEPTPEEYVSSMVEVFREVRRVLAKHGTCWLNLGDSYASGLGAGRQGQNGQRADRTFTAEGMGKSVPPGLKPKDLVGIPWRVAQALQEPYYTGRIKDERDRIWLAAMVDTEGSIGINFQRGGKHRARDVYSVSVKVHNCSEVLVRRCAEVAGVGTVALAESRNRPVFVWSVYGVKARELLRELYPHLVAKQHEARLAYAHESGVGDAAKARYESLRRLHAGQPASGDVAPPPSLYEPGWYLRSDIIWAKPNPMPESVTDRPTKAHEYVFLLTKSPRYFFDQEAVREEANWERWGDQTYSPEAEAMYGQRIKPRPKEHLRKRNHGGRTDGYTVGEGGAGFRPNPAGRNIRSVWEIATQPYPEAHFATYPEALVERCLKAGCPEQVCRTCGKPRERLTEASYVKSPVHGAGSVIGRHYETGSNNFDGAGMPRLNKEVTTLGFTDCGHSDYRPGAVLDPFLGSGTTALIARRLGRHCAGIELSLEYAELAARRLSQLSLLAEGTA